MEVVLDHWEQRLVYHALLRWYRQEKRISLNLGLDPEKCDLIIDLRKLIRKFGADPDNVLRPEDEVDAKAEEAYSLFVADRKQEEEATERV